MLLSGKRGLKNLTHRRHHGENSSCDGEQETNWKKEALEGRRKNKNQDTRQKDTQEKAATPNEVIVSEANGSPGGVVSQDSHDPPIRGDPEQKASEDEGSQPHEVNMVWHASPDHPSDVSKEELQGEQKWCRGMPSRWSYFCKFSFIGSTTSSMMQLSNVALPSIMISFW
jgi:hypothetical protein